MKVVRRSLALAVALAALALVGARPAAAQQPADQLVDRELAYEAAGREYQAALAAWRVVEKQWDDATEEHRRSAADEARRNAALTRALDASRELDSLERRVADRRTAFERARTAYVAAIDDRLRQLELQLDGARTTADRARVAALIRDLENRQGGLDEEMEATTARVPLLYLPQLQFDPRDTPETMVSKAQLLRNKAQRADSLLARIDRDIESITRQLRRSRTIESVTGELQRFGDVQPPGAPGRRLPGGDVRAPADSTGVSRPQLTPEQRLAELRLLRAQVQEAIRQFLERAQLFEQTARRMG